MLTLDDLRDAVDAYTGALRFAVPIASVPGITSSDWALALLYDSTTVDETVTGWNLSHPTGVAGLGWSVPVDRIEVERGDELGGDQTLAGSTHTLVLAGRRYRLVPAGGGPVSGQAGTRMFATVPHEFWRAAYNPADESWTVTLDDGSTLLFGDTATGRGTVDRGYAWGNWSGASVRAADRRPVATGWSLARRTDVWGNTTTFGYTQTEATLGGTTPVGYTRDTRLSRIDGPDGSALVLRYADKEAVEYTDPYGGPAAPGWQSRFGARVLAAVDQVAPGGTVVATTTLDYLGPGGTLASVGSGDRTKRLLTGVSRQAPGGYRMPALSFGYDTDPTSDSYGALTSVVTMAGGEATISYTRPALSLPRRDIVLEPPAAGATDPRVFLGADYAVVLWRAADGSAHATGYRWQGRWLAGPLSAPTVADDAAYQALRVVCGQDCFAIVGATRYTLYHADPALPGGWIGPTAAEPIGLPSDEPVALAAGRDHVALTAGRTGTMTLRWFDGTAWQTLAVPAPAAATLAAVGGSAENLVRVTSSGGRDHRVLLAHPAPDTGGWTTSMFTLRESVPALDTVTVTLGESYAVVTLAGWAGTERAVSHVAARWNTDFTSLETALLSRRVGPATGASATGRPEGTSATGAASDETVRVAGATVLIGQDVWRFDGGAWRHQDLGALTHPDQREVVALGLGPDMVTRSVRFTDGSLRYDLITYNPADPGSTPWGYAAGLSGLPARPGSTTATPARFGPTRPGAASRFLLLNNTLYLRAGDGSFSSVLKVPTLFDATSIASLVLAGGSFLAYQTATGVRVHPLTGGGPDAPAGIDLPGSRLLPAAGPPLAVPGSFVAYTGDWAAGDAVRNLYRVVAEDVRGPVAPLAVAGVIRYASGGAGGTGPLPYDAIPTSYDHGEGSATVSDDGRMLEVNHATVTEAGADGDPQRFGTVHTYVFNRLTVTEAPELPYPTGPQTNATANLGHLAGTRYAVRTLDRTGAQVLTDTMWWWVSRAASGGTYHRARKETTHADGVPGERTLSYDPDTGQLTGLDATLADGTLIHTTYTYWWQAYDPGRTRNLLTPVIQCLQYAGSTLVRGAVTTWSDQWAAGPGRWAPRACYLATESAPAEFTAWTGAGPAPSGWRLTQSIADRTGAGLVTLTRDALGRSYSSVCSADGTRELTAFGNADVSGQEAYHYNCEPYEDPGPWTYRGGTIDAHLVDREANLGSHCLRVAPNPTGATGPVAAWTPAGQERSYLFSCWVQTDAGLVDGDATVVLGARAGGHDLGRVTLTLPETAGRWSYVSAVVPLPTWRASHNVPSGTPATITALVTNTRAGLEVFVDSLRFQPSDTDFYAGVPDPSTNLPLGSLGANGVTYRLVRDANRFVTATVGPDATTARLAVPAFARLATSDGTYASAFPNTLLEAEAGSAAIYQNFEVSDAGQWTLPDGWHVGAGRLTFSGSQPQIPGSLAALTGFASPSYVAYVRFQPPESGPAPDVGIGCGNVVAMHLAGPDAWVLATTVDGRNWTQGTAVPGPLGHGDVVFTLLGDRVTVFAAGRQVFSDVVPAPVVPDGGLRLSLTGAGAFRDLVVLADPELRLTLLDGRGLAQQSIDLRDADQVEARGAVTDAIGRPGYDKNGVAVPLALLGGRIAGGPDAYLPPVGGTSSPTLAEYLRFGNGSPFVRTVPEESPLARLSQLGLPGDELAVGGGHTTGVTYSRNTATGPMGGLVPDGQAGNYELVGVTDPDHAANYRLVSSSGEVVAHRTMFAGAASLTRGFTTDPAGRLTGVTEPNGYAGSDLDAWRTRYNRDFLGQVVEVDSPDEGRSQTAYDAAGRPRFTRSAADAAANPPRFGYRRYDGLNRVVEEGTVGGVDWAVALARVDDAGWPDAGVLRAVFRTMSYDVPVAGGTADGMAQQAAQGTAQQAVQEPARTEGRLTGLTGYGPDGATVTAESYEYDVAGRVTVQRTQALAYGPEVWVSGYTYDSRGNVILVRYPRVETDGSPPLAVAYTYDRRGRIVAVGRPAPGGFVDPLNPPPDLSGRYGRFGYGPDDSLATASYQNDDPANAPVTVDYTYSPAGWPLSVTSAVYSEQTGYTSGGYGDAGSYRGLPVSTRRWWQASGRALYPLRDETARYAYDAAGRLTAAAPYLAPNPPALPASPASRDMVAAEAAGDPPLVLDANGNPLSATRGDATVTYHYPQTVAARAADDRPRATADDPVRPSDRLQDLVVTLASSCTFEAAPPSGWSWGASDGGPGGATVVDGGPTTGRCLNLPGGVLGSASVLTYRGYADPRGSYTLRYQVRADPDFATQPGPAGWYVVLHGPDGPVATALAAAITDPSTGWTPQTVTFDLTGLYQVHSDYAQVVEVSFTLRNHRGPGDGTRGAALQVDDLVLTGGGDLGAIEYDDSGRVTALAGAGLSGLAYAPDSNTLAVFRTAAVGGYTMTFALGETGEYATREADPVDPDGVPGATLYLRTPDGRLLARLQRWGGQVSRRFYLEGPTGTFAVEDDGEVSYLIRSGTSGACAVTDVHGNLTQFYDVDVFGAVRASVPGGPDPLDRLGAFDTLRPAPPVPYAPWLGRTLAPAPRPCPPADATEAGAEPAGYTTWLDLLPRVARTPVNFLWLNVIDGTRYMGHNPDAWFVYGLLTKGFAVLAADRRAGPYRLPLAATAVAATVGPYAEGVLRFLHARWRTDDCEARGLLRIQSPTLIEDIYHGQFYEPLESLSGARRLRLRGVEVIPSGFYIFVVTEAGEFRYREMSDRAGGNELYVRHSMLASGGCARTAGMMVVFGDEIVLTNQSGHYQPTVELVEQYAVPLLRAAGYDQYRITVCGREEIDMKLKMIEFRRRTGRVL